MAPEFINEFEITYDIYKGWVNHPLGQKARKNKMKRNLWKMAGLFISVFLILLGIYLPENAAIFIGIAFLGAMLYLAVLLPGTAARKQYKLAIAENTNQPWKRTITFSNVIHMADFRTDAEYKYTQVSQVTEDKSYYYIWLGSDYVLRILKSAFTRGSADAFRGYILSKTKKNKNNQKSR
jgi:hypothetical protein